MHSNLSEIEPMNMVEEINDPASPEDLATAIARCLEYLTEDARKLESTRLSDLLKTATDVAYRMANCPAR